MPNLHWKGQFHRLEQIFKRDSSVDPGHIQLRRLHLTKGFKGIILPFKFVKWPFHNWQKKKWLWALLVLQSTCVTLCVGSLWKQSAGHKCNYLVAKVAVRFLCSTCHCEKQSQQSLLEQYFWAIANLHILTYRTETCMHDTHTSTPILQRYSMVSLHHGILRKNNRCMCTSTVWWPTCVPANQLVYFLTCNVVNRR